MWSSPGSPGWLMFLETSLIPAQDISFSSIFCLRRWRAQAMFRERRINQYSVQLEIFLTSAHRDLVTVCEWFISVTGYCSWTGGLGSLLYESYILQTWGFWKFQSHLYVLGCTPYATVQGDFEHCLRFICCVHGGHCRPKQLVLKSLWKFSICLFSDYKVQVYLKELFYPVLIDTEVSVCSPTMKK